MRVGLIPHLNSTQDLLLRSLVVARVHDDFGVGPPLLCSPDGSPENSFASTSSITASCQPTFQVAPSIQGKYQKGWKNPTMPDHSLSALSPMGTFPCIEASIFFQISFLPFSVSSSVSLPVFPLLR